MIGLQLGCSDQTVRNALRAFNQWGTAALSRRSSRPVTIYPAFDGEGIERLCALLRRPPRDFGKDADSWTLSLIAEVCFAEGLTAERISGETVRATLARSGVRWRRAKRWFVTPDRPYPHKKEAPGP